MPPGRSLAIAGAWLQFLFIAGVVGSTVAFGLAVDGPPTVTQHIDSIMLVLLLGSIGIIVGLVGLSLLCVALLRSGYRAEWLFWFLVIYGPFVMLCFPLGTPFGIFFLVYGLMRRREFFRRDAMPPS